MKNPLELIHAPATIEGSEGLLAIIIRSNFYMMDYGINFYTKPEHGLQLAVMSRPAGYLVPPHKHTAIHPQTEGTQEVLFIRGGEVRLDLYTSSGEHVTHRDLQSGDIVMLVSGGHSLEFICESDVLEVKQGPYPGPHDKVLLKGK